MVIIMIINSIIIIIIIIIIAIKVIIVITILIRIMTISYLSLKELTYLPRVVLLFFFQIPMAEYKEVDFLFPEI